MSDKEKIRVTFDFQEQALRKLDEMVDVMKSESRADVVRQALALLCTGLEDGVKIIVEKNGSIVKELDFRNGDRL